jgi:hypothetical protein
LAADLDWQSIAEAGALVRVIDDIENDPVDIVTPYS